MSTQERCGLPQPHLTLTLPLTSPSPSPYPYPYPFSFPLQGLVENMLREREANRRRQDLRSAISAAQKKRDEDAVRQLDEALPDEEYDSEDEVPRGTQVGRRLHVGMAGCG
jgi:hypothetical protein